MGRLATKRNNWNLFFQSREHYRTELQKNVLLLWVFKNSNLFEWCDTFAEWYSWSLCLCLSSLATLRASKPMDEESGSKFLDFTISRFASFWLRKECLKIGGFRESLTTTEKQTKQTKQETKSTKIKFGCVYKTMENRLCFVLIEKAVNSNILSTEMRLLLKWLKEIVEKLKQSESFKIMIFCFRYFFNATEILSLAMRLWRVWDKSDFANNNNNLKCFSKTLLISIFLELIACRDYSITIFSLASKYEQIFNPIC